MSEAAARVEAIKAELKRVGARNDRWVRCSMCHEPWTDDHKHTPGPDDDPMDFCMYHRQEGGTIWTDYDGMAAWVADLLATRDAALAESVKLQSYYAEALNLYDGGHRIVFKDAADWMARLAMTPAERVKDSERRAALAPRGAATEANE